MPKGKKDPPPEQDGKLDLLKEIKLPSPVLGLDGTPDGKTLYAACMDGSICQVDAETSKIDPLLKHQSYASGVWLLPKSGVLISAGYDGVLQSHDIRKGQAL